MSVLDCNMPTNEEIVKQMVDNYIYNWGDLGDNGWLHLKLPPHKKHILITDEYKHPVEFEPDKLDEYGIYVRHYNIYIIKYKGPIYGLCRCLRRTDAEFLTLMDVIENL